MAKPLCPKCGKGYATSKADACYRNDCGFLQPNKGTTPIPSVTPDPAVTSMMSLAEQEIVALLRKMVANQREIIELLKDISIGFA